MKNMILNLRLALVSYITTGVFSPFAYPYWDEAKKKISQEKKKEKKDE